MNKKLLAAAIAAAVVAAPAAFADSTVYGKMHTSIDVVDDDNTSEDNVMVENRASRLGFKGSEDLGNGMKAIYQIEFGIRSDGGDQQNVGDGQTAQRNTFVGLATDYGTVVVGRHDTPAKMAFYAAGNEQLGDSIIDINRGGNNPIGVFTEVRANNAIAYVSPNWSGFSFAAAVIPGEEADTVVDAADGFADHYSVGLMYKGYGFRAGIGYEQLVPQAFGGSGDDPEHEMLQAGASYTFNNFKIGAHYENTDNFGTDADGELTAWAISGKATFGNNAISVVYTDSELEDCVTCSDHDKSGWGLAGEHKFSKRTSAYAAYATSDDDESDQDHDRFSIGMIHKF